jgi:HAD superfamily hydrolase (TIGR01509 family)
MSLSAIVFDFDGLIIDTEGPGFFSWQEAYQQFGKSLTLDDWRHSTGYVGGFDPAIHLERLLGRKLDWSDIMPKRSQRNWELTLEAGVLPGIKELIEAAKQSGLPVGVASNSEQAWVEGGLKRLGLRSYVDVIVTRDMVLNPKPAPDVYLKAVETLHVSPSRGVALEDSEPGYRAAKRAGLKTVVIPNQFSERQDLSDADLIVRSALELDLDRLARLVEGGVPKAIETTG